MIAAGRPHEAWAKLPLGSLEDIIGAGPCLFLAWSPDHESLGCGGLIAACCAPSRPPSIVISTDGSTSRPARLAALREVETRQAVASFGLSPAQVRFLREIAAHLPAKPPAILQP